MKEEFSVYFAPSIIYFIKMKLYPAVVQMSDNKFIITNELYKSVEDARLELPGCSVIDLFPVGYEMTTESMREALKAKAKAKPDSDW